MASSSSLVLFVLVLLYSIFVCDSASELERWALLLFGGFAALTCLFVIIFRNLLHIFSCKFLISIGVLSFLHEATQRTIHNTSFTSVPYIFATSRIGNLTYPVDPLFLLYVRPYIVVLGKCGPLLLSGSK